jgi:hypothetical protein
MLIHKKLSIKGWLFTYNYFSYLKELAGSIDFQNDNDFISKQFEYMSAVSPNSVLSKYLNHKKIKATTNFSK